MHVTVDVHLDINRPWDYVHSNQLRGHIPLDNYELMCIYIGDIKLIHHSILNLCIGFYASDLCQFRGRIFKDGIL
jgi:hypothetical protein